MTDAERTLDITQQHHPTGTIVLTVTGELDHHTGPLLDRTLDDTSFDSFSGAVLDLAGLEYCDSTGLTLIIKAHQRAEAAGCPLGVAAPSDDLMRVFRITGIEQFLSVYPDTERAIDAVSR